MFYSLSQQITGRNPRKVVFLMQKMTTGLHDMTWDSKRGYGFRDISNVISLSRCLVVSLSLILFDRNILFLVKWLELDIFLVFTADYCENSVKIQREYPRQLF